MISKDALRYLRSVTGRRYRQYVCPFCTSRAISSTSVNPRNPNTLPKSSRSYASTSSPRQKPSLESTPDPGADLAALAIGNGNVREYLKKWSQKQDEQDALLGNEIVSDKRPWVPSSLFVRDISALDEAKETGGDTEPEYDLDEDAIYTDLKDIASSHFAYVQPGDVYSVRAQEVAPQLALHLGYVGRQSQLLLENGKWFQGMTLESKGCELLHNFASAKEIAKLKAIMPKNVIRPNESIDDNGLTAIGDVPAHVFKPFADRFRRLQDESDTFRRDFIGKFDQLYEQLAHETDYKAMNLLHLADSLAFDYPGAPGGARMAFIEKLASDHRFILQRTQNEEVHNAVFVLPRRVVDSIRIVANWARDYQDAAARASAGKDVLPELRANPLTQFIAKARKLISKSRTIRTFDDCLYPTKTFPDATPSHELVERRPTGEGFTEQDKAIIIMIWDTYLRMPKSTNHQLKLQASIIALILRAVGAYPEHKLDKNVAFLFLKELGCKEPWSYATEDSIDMPMPFLGLNHELKLVEQREANAIKALKLDGAPEENLLKDTLADMRKDWKDMKAFAVDPVVTRLLDDAFSIEPSTESPDLTWIHVHIAHPAAFIPPHHELLARPELMRQGYYGQTGGSTPYLPIDLLDNMSISDKRSSPVMTVSTLIHADGSVRDVQVAAATIRDVSRIDTKAFTEFYNQRTIFDFLKDEDMYKLEVGRPSTNAMNPMWQLSQRQQSIRESSAELCKQHESKLRLMDQLLRARFEARKRENPNHLRTQRDVPRFLRVKVDASGEPDPSFERILKSEHCYGDPHVLITRSSATHAQSTSTYADYPEHLGVMYQLRLLATESFGMFTRKHKIPVMYTVVEPLPEFPMEALNNSTRYDRIAWPITGKSLRPGPQVFLNLQQQVPANSPLRAFPDLINQYQIGAFLKSQASGSAEPKSITTYPYSKADLKHLMDSATHAGLDRSDANFKNHWIFYALYHSWRHNPDFPKTLDARISTTLANHVTVASKGLRTAYLQPWPIRIYLEPTEQGYEMSAKPSQCIPVKITSFDPTVTVIRAVAIGPASDDLNFPQNFLPTKESAAPSTDKH